MDDYDEKDQTLKFEGIEEEGTPDGSTTIQNSSASHLSTYTKSSPVQRPTSITIGPEPDFSPPLTSSPIGCTLKGDFGTQFDQIFHSESFNVNDETAVLDIRIFFSDGKAVQFPVENGQEVMAADLLVLMAEHLEIDEEVASDALALWMISPLLEVQLKPYHVAFDVRKKWSVFLRRFTTAKEEEILFDEPLLVLKRNVDLSIHHEQAVEDEFERLTEVLYLEAKDEFMSGRNLVELDQAIQLAGIQMAIEYNAFESDEDAMDLLKEKMSELIPSYLLHRCKTFQLFGLSVMECKKGCEKQILEHYKTASEYLANNHARRKAYLDILRKTPFYGSAFFYGQTDRKPASSLFGATRRFFNGVTPQLELRIGINQDLVTIVDDKNNELLLARRISDCSWFRSKEANPDEDIPSFFLHFPDDSAVQKLEEEKEEKDFSDQHSSSGISSDHSNFMSRLLQIYTKQAPLIDQLLNVILERNLSDFGSSEEFYGAESPASNVHSDDMLSPSSSRSQHPLSNLSTKSTTSSIANKSIKSNMSNFSTISTFSSSKLSKLCLATLDPQGNCIEAHGTLRRIFQECES